MTDMEKFFELFKRDFKTERLELHILEPTIENARLVWNVVKDENPADFAYIHFSPKYDKPLPESADEVLTLMQNEDKMANENGAVWYIFHDDKLVGYQRIHYWESIKTIQFAAVWFIKSAWGHGFNKEVRDLVEKIGFENLRIHRVTIQCMETNVRSKNSIINSGYHLDGIMRDANLMSDGTWVNHMNFSKLENEYRQQKLSDV